MQAEKVVVAIPVKDEEARIGACLDALSRQTRFADAIILLLNNCTDSTAKICQAASRKIPALHIIECVLPAARTSAGEARRLALCHALSLAGDGIILTGDADSVPPPSWIASNLVEFADGADVVCGRAEIDSEEAKQIRRGLHFDDMREGFFLSLLDEIDAIIDPDPADPWPRHQQNSGASIAMRAPVLRAAGGAPHVPVGEDRALIEKFRLIDAKIRHAPQICVRVSGRIEGRAAGGMADAIKRRMQVPDIFTDAGIEPAIDAYRRALAKTRLRHVMRAAADAAALAEDLLISHAALGLALRRRYFGAAWTLIQELSPVLQRRRVAYAELARETRHALRLRDQLLLETNRDSKASTNESGLAPNHRLAG